MKKLFLLIFIFTTVLYAETAIVPLDKAKEIADRNAATLWGNVNPGEPIIYYSIDDNIVAYRFNYAINTQFLTKQALIDECNQGKLDGNREAQWGNGNYGNILMSARKDMPVNLEYGLGISSEYAYGVYIQEQAEEHLGFNYSLKKIYYINGVNVWYHYTNGLKDIYIKPHSPAKVGNEQEFRSAADEFEFFCETGNFDSEWEDYLDRQRTISRTVREIIYHDECCPFYDWSYGCSPTAAAMLVAYWDHRSMYSASNYSKFVDYHFERTDPLSGGSCSIDSHCPNVMPQLATAMNTDLATGGTYRSDIAPGYNTVASNNGYSFSCSYNSGQTTTWYFNKVVSEINADRPLHISISGHSITGVGYNDVDETVSTHYTHQPWLVNITKSQLQATYPIIPGGATGLGIEIEKPDGDQNYYGTGSGETLSAGDVYEVTWDYDSSTGSYVKIYYSTNHGVSWTTITSNTPNDGVYDWVIPSGINSTACRIATESYYSSNVFAGCDGSYGDFQINSGGSIQILGSDGKVNTTTAPDYYQFNNAYSTWSAVGVRNNTAGDNWSMKMYTDNTFATELVSSAYTYPVDFVVMDGHHSPAQYRGIKAYRYSGSNNASVEFEGFNETLNIGTNSDTWPAGDVVEMYDVYLTPGTYGFGLDITSGTADLDIALFGSSGSAYYADRQAYLARSINSGGGVDEQFSYTITTADYYGVCVWANDASSASFTIKIEEPGSWTGLGGTSNWHVAGNWSANIIPDATMDVTIPAGTPHDPGIWLENAYCNNLTLESGASLHVYDDSGVGETLRLYVSNDMNVYGYIYMWGGTESYDGEIQIGHDIKWHSGSRIYTTANDQILRVYEDWYMYSGAEVHMDNGKIMFMGSNNGYIESYESSCYLNDVMSYKTGGAHIGFSYLSTTDIYVNGDIYIQTGAAFNGYNPYHIYLQGDINNHGTFIYDYGTLVMTGSNQYIRLNTGCYLNNFTVNSTGTVYFADTYSSTLTVNGNVQIDSGELDCGSNIIEVGGNWTNTVGTAGFTEGTGRVIFNGGNYHQYCSNETFNELEVNKASGGALRMNGTDVVCAAYDWTAGAVDVLSGSFTANDLLDNGISGAFYLNSGGTIDLINSGTGLYVDLNGELHIFGGTMTVTGSISDWPYTHEALIEMSGGILDFTNCGISLTTNHGLTTDITGGTIRTIRDFTGTRTDFDPTGGTIELYGTIDANMSMGAGSNFYDVLINKAATDEITKESKDKKRISYNRDGSVVELTRSNTVTATSELDINGDLQIDAGTFNLNGNTVNVANDVDVYGTLNMTNIADILNVGNTAYDNLAFRNGSFGNLAAGVVNLASWVWVDVGGLLTATIGNTMNFIAPSVAGIEVDAAGSVFGNINVISATPLRLWSYSSQLIEVDGNFDLQAGNIIDFQNHSMIVHGLFTDDPTSTVYVYDGPVDGGNTKLFSADDNSENQKNFIDPRSRGGSLEIDNDFTLTGLMDVGDGNVLVHGVFGIAATGSMLIDGGSFIADAPYHGRGWEYLYGNLSMTTGLFEITENSTRFESTATTTISGGTIRTGGAFHAADPGVFQPTGGTVEIIGDNLDVNIYCHNNNNFYNLVVNRSGGNYCDLESGDVTVVNDFTISNGTLRQHVANLYIGGNWTNNVGAAGFDEGTNTLTFNGTGDVVITPGETFYNLTLDKVSSADWLTLNGNLIIGNDLVINPGALYSGSNTISVNGNATLNSGGVLYMQANSTLELDDASSLNVNSGGYLYVVGSSGNHATVTHQSTGFYGFNIYSGGNIGAQYAIFEYMNGNGIYLLSGANLHSSFTFNHSIFRNGHDAPSALLALNSDNVFTCTGASFDNNASGLTGYNVWKATNTGEATFDGGSGDFWGEDYDYDPYNRVHWTGGVLPAIDDLTIQYNAGPNEIELNWTYPVPVDQYKIYRSTDPYDFSGADIFIVYTESYSETVTTTKYFYYVTAENITDNVVSRKNGILGKIEISEEAGK